MNKLLSSQDPTLPLGGRPSYAPLISVTLVTDHPSYIILAAMLDISHQDFTATAWDDDY